MNRALYSTLALLLVSTSVFGQELPAPQQKDPFATNNATIQSTGFQAVAQNQIPAPSVDAPVKQVKPYAMSIDKQTYSSAGYQYSGVSDYRIQVAREKARARRMRIEAKKWYGIDSARPTTLPSGSIGVYSAYYNGVYSRPHYYNRSATPYYYYQSVNR